jgi:hypothetical protein
VTRVFHRRRPAQVGCTGITVRGQAAIDAAELGATLYVLNPQHGWVVGGRGALERAKKLVEHGGWVYGVHKDWKSEVRT